MAAAETNFISLVSQRIAPRAEADISKPQHYYPAEVATDLLNVRTLPSRSGAALKQLKRGVEVNVYEDRNGWSRIDPVSSCWVSSDFLHPTASSKVSALYCAQVMADLLNVRSLPCSAGKVITQRERGSMVYVYEERDNWSRIDEENSQWVSSAYLARMTAAAI